MAEAKWQFSIDVGGTFTDCLAIAPDGTQYRHKLLSSGVVKGAMRAGSHENLLVDDARKNDPHEFWNGATLSLLDEAGIVTAKRQVARFDSERGQFELTASLDRHRALGTRYELRHDYDAPVLAIRYLLGLPAQAKVPSVVLRLGTTRGTNALLTRTGANSALVVTKGFGDVLRIGYQDRPNLFELAIKKRKPLTELTVEVDERVSAEGEILVVMDRQRVRQQLFELKESGVDSLAICLMHADLYPQHEILVEEIARDVGFSEISRSSEVSPLVKMVARAETTLVDAYLNPVLRTYFAKLQKDLPGSQIRLMTSSGGLTSIESFRGCQSVLSGPAGGVVGYAKAAERVGYSKAIGFDMGGTSTDVSRYAGKYEQEFESEKAGVRLMTPTLAIETIAAGGGSICWFDGVKLRVGPDSAGADPGPACYGRGGPLTVTDVNLALGRVLPDHFPFQLDKAASLNALVVISQQVEDKTGERLSAENLAEGFLKIANANMAGAIRNVTVAKGVQPEEHLLVAFGGAAAQHACAVADELGIREILHHPDAGILSAYGISVAEEVRHATRGLWQSLVMFEEADFERIFAELAEIPKQEFASEGATCDRLEFFPSLEVHYTGSDAKLTIPYHSFETIQPQFEELHQVQFGYLHTERSLHVASARLEVRLPVSREESSLPINGERTLEEISSHKIISNGQTLSVPVHERTELATGMLIIGPALIAQKHTLAVVDPTWQAKVLERGELLLSKCDQAPSEVQATKSQAVELEIFNNLLVGVAERMGHVLRRTSVSVNVKERLDYSCAVFTGEGKLVANAPHVPVHLGAMGITVRSLLADNPDLQSEDIFLSNDPYRGGSHLPDITMVLPVHDETTGKLLFCTACRAHHAEIGGVQPGSMPPNSTKVAEEGVLISNFLYRRNGKVFEKELKELFTNAPYPSRNPNENLADLAAQAAAVERGAKELKQIVREHGKKKLIQQMQAVQRAAEQKVRQSLAGFAAGKYEFQDFIETASGVSVPIKVTITLQRPNSSGTNASDVAAVFDFSGTGEVIEGNLNANRAIVTAAVLYTLRLLVDEDIPLNEGVLDAVEIVLPECMLNPTPSEAPGDSPAVAAGNVETSQRVVDVLLGAFGIAAASQGTMNNVLFGDESFGYYETLGGGSGATSESDGADAVQIHMTNTRSTDPEILERRLPVRLWEMSIRKNSGGAGKYKGGDGMQRKLEFLKRLKLSLITGRRGPHAPFGLGGAQAGQCGQNRLRRVDGTIENLPGICQRNVFAGDSLEIATPGGGGFGEPKEATREFVGGCGLASNSR